MSQGGGGRLLGNILWENVSTFLSIISFLEGAFKRRSTATEPEIK